MQLNHSGSTGGRWGDIGLQDTVTNAASNAVYSAWRPGQDGRSELHCVLEVSASAHEETVGEQPLRLMSGQLLLGGTSQPRGRGDC